MHIRVEYSLQPFLLGRLADWQWQQVVMGKGMVSCAQPNHVHAQMELYAFTATCVAQIDTGPQTTVWGPLEKSSRGHDKGVSHCGKVFLTKVGLHHGLYLLFRLDYKSRRTHIHTPVIVTLYVLRDNIRAGRES